MFQGSLSRLLQPCSMSADSPAIVFSAFDLQRETELGTPHIVIQDHLDLTQLEQVPLTSTGGERIVVRNTTLSIRVRAALHCAFHCIVQYESIVPAVVLSIGVPYRASSS